MLLIKTGNSETLYEKKSSDIVSMGDVFRTSFLIKEFEAYELTWLTSREAEELLRVFFPTLKIISGVDELTDEVIALFDVILNLEKSDSVLLRFGGRNNTYGFVNEERGYFKKLFAINEKNSNSKFWSDVNEDEVFEVELCRVVGIPFIPNKNETPSNVIGSDDYQIGFNWHVGKKWPEKRIPKKFWSELERELSLTFTISWQKGFDNIDEYIRWIDSCDILVTLDSLGLHLGKALGKKVLALFGPTNSSQIELCNGSKHFYSQNLKNNNSELDILIKQVVKEALIMQQDS